MTHARAGIIAETEAYAGVGDRASHAHGGRRTERTEVMYAREGPRTCYLCYGIHHLFNVVTNRKMFPTPYWSVGSFRSRSLDG